MTVEQYANELAYRDRELERLGMIEKDYHNVIAARDFRIKERDSLYATHEQTLDYLEAFDNERNAATLDALTGQLEAIKITRDIAMAYRDSAIKEREAVVAELESVSASLNTVLIERNSRELELDAAVKKLDSVKNELDRVFSSRSWRLTKFLRYLKRTVTHH